MEHVRSELFLYAVNELPSDLESDTLPLRHGSSSVRNHFTADILIHFLWHGAEAPFDWKPQAIFFFGFIKTDTQGCTS